MMLHGIDVPTRIRHDNTRLEAFNLHTIVCLPKGVFSPYTSIATNILFFEKGSPTQNI